MYTQAKMEWLDPVQLDFVKAGHLQSGKRTGVYGKYCSEVCSVLPYCCLWKNRTRHWR